MRRARERWHAVAHAEPAPRTGHPEPATPTPAPDPREAPR
jgi:hypothetical protein